MTYLLIAYYNRKDVDDILTAMLFHDTDSSSDECESESDDDLEFLLLDSLFSPMHELGPHLKLLDVEETACEQWFRYVHYIKPDTKWEFV